MTSGLASRKHCDPCCPADNILRPHLQLVHLSNSSVFNFISYGLRSYYLFHELGGKASEVVQWVCWAADPGSHGWCYYHSGFSRCLCALTRFMLILSVVMSMPQIKSKDCTGFLQWMLIPCVLLFLSTLTKTTGPSLSPAWWTASEVPILTLSKTFGLQPLQLLCI